MTKEMCDKVVYIFLLLIDSIQDKYNSREMCDEIVSKLSFIQK